MPLDPMTEDDIAIDERLDEAIREARWDAFVAHLKTTRPACVLRHLADLMDGKDDWNYQRAYAELRAFHETEGYAGILAAMSRAIREQGTV